MTGDEYVIYRAGQNGSARVHGEVGHVIRGETAELYAQPFPYRHAPVPAGSVVLKASRSGAAYAFSVTPAWPRATTSSCSRAAARPPRWPGRGP